MTIPAAIAHVEYLASGGVTYVYPFQIDLPEELEVRVEGRIQTETVEYTLTGVGYHGGGTITFFVPPLRGLVISLRRIVDIEQLLDLIPNAALPAVALEDQLDEIVKQIQMLEEALSRRPSLAVGTKSVLRDLTIPAPGNLTLWGWNADGTGMSLYDPAIVRVIPETGDPVPGPSGWFQATRTVVIHAIPGVTRIPVPDLYPAGAYIRSVTMEVTEEWGDANGLVAMMLGDDVLIDRWGSNIGRAVGVVTNPAFFRTNPFSHPADTPAFLTSEFGLFDNLGEAFVTCHYEVFQPDTPAGGQVPTGGWAHGKNTVLLTAAPFAGQDRIPVPLLYPAAAYVRSATMRITQGFGSSGGLTGIDFGDLAVADRWGDDLSPVLGTVTDPSSFNNPQVGFSHAAATDAFLAARGGPFDAIGAAIITCHFEIFLPDTEVP